MLEVAGTVFGVNSMHRNTEKGEFWGTLRKKMNSNNEGN